ncbi:hypothetical protein ACP4OV_023543 [Aristida adscensionis]
MSSTAAAAPEAAGWSSLPGDLLETILQLLPWSSHPRFAATCRHWRSAVSPFYPAWLTPLLLNAADVGSTSVRYYSPYFHKSFEVGQTLQTPNAKICCADGHRLTLSHRANNAVTVVDVNLATGEIADLCPLDSTEFQFVVFDATRRRMLGVSAIGVLVVARAIEVEDDAGCWFHWEWSEYRADGPELQLAPVTNPVIHRGLLYALGADGRLAVHDVGRQVMEEFEILDKPRGFGLEHHDCYLFESDEGELMAVLFGHRGTPVHIVRLDEQTMEWEKVESLEGRALFTGTFTTMMVKTDVKWMQNRVFLPRLYDLPEIVHAKLVDREGELAFVPRSTTVLQDGGVIGKDIWTCKYGDEEVKEFWETTKFDYSIWVDFKCLTSC